MRKKTYFSGVLPDLYSVNDYVMMMKMMMLIISMYLRVAFDSFSVRFTFIFSEGLFACL